jgi:DNA mismatch repair protein MutS
VTGPAPMSSGPAPVPPAVSVLLRTPADQPVLPDALDRAALEDLNLDQLLGALARRRPSYDLAPTVTRRLTDPDAVAYRQEVFRDLDRDDVREAVERFCTAMARLRRFRSLASSRQAPAERRSWHLHAGRAYVEAVTRLAADLTALEVRSRALARLRAHLEQLLASGAFRTLAADSDRVHAALGAVRYRLHLVPQGIEVLPDDGDAPDLTAALATTFGAFLPDDVPATTAEPRRAAALTHLEAEVLDRVAELEPATFAALARYVEDHPRPEDPTVLAFDRDIQFYLAYLEHVASLRRAGLPFCEPVVTGDGSPPTLRGIFDLVLADKLLTEGTRPVGNDLVLADPERIVVVTGANQGGKTTFARTLGQLHHLAAIGCPVPGREVRLSLPDRILTHFAREERLADRHGRLQDDLLRMRSILDAAGAASLVILNELFRSTTIVDARVLGERILDRLAGIGALTLYVTFIDELAARGPDTVSLVATVDATDPALRTFRLERRPADGRAHAAAIAERHGLTYAAIRERHRV